MQWQNSISKNRNQTSNKSPINIDDLMNELGEYIQSSNKLNIEKTNIHMHNNNNNNINFSSNQINSNFHNTINNYNTNNLNYINQNTNNIFFDFNGESGINKKHDFINNNNSTNNIKNIIVNHNTNYNHYNVNSPSSNHINQIKDFDSASRNIERLNDIFHKMGDGENIYNINNDFRNNLNLDQTNIKLNYGNFYERKMTSPIKDDEFEEVHEECNNYIMTVHSEIDKNKSDLFNQFNNINNKIEKESTLNDQKENNNKFSNIMIMSNNTYNSSNLNPIQAPETKIPFCDFNVNLIFDNFDTQNPHYKEDEFQEVEEQEPPVINNKDLFNISNNDLNQIQNLDKNNLKLSKNSFIY